MSTEKKETFRKYLETSGVIDAMTKALVALYESEAKPQKAVDFLKTQLGAPTPEDMAAMQAEKEDLSKQLEEAQKRIEELEARVAELEGDK